MTRPLVSIFVAALFFASCVSMGERYTSKTPARVKTSKNEPVQVYSGPAASDSVKLNVLIFKASNGVTITSDKPIEVLSENVPRSKKYFFRAVDGRIEAENYFFTTPKIELRSDAYMSLGKKKYRGNFTIYAQGGELLVVNRIPLEEYLYGVLPSEIPPTWDPEALRAQAVAARTFALYQKSKSKDNRWDLESTVTSQVYNGLSKEDPRTNKAVNDTSAKVIYYNNSLIEAFFHSNSGGRTASSEEVWGGKYSYLVPVDDEYASEGSHFKWDAVISKSKIEAALDAAGKNTGPVQSLSIIERSNSGRADKIIVRAANGEFAIKGKDLRQWLGVDLIKSTKFDLSDQAGQIYFEGRGWGHGVGMSQEGAWAMAKRGVGHESIIKYYYRGTEIRKAQ